MSLNSKQSVKLIAKTPIFPYNSTGYTKQWTELGGLNSRRLRPILAEKQKVTLEATLLVLGRSLLSLSLPNLIMRL